eukprot:5201375-Amphidinium_carterae.1
MLVGAAHACVGLYRESLVVSLLFSSVTWHEDGDRGGKFLPQVLLCHSRNSGANLGRYDPCRAAPGCPGQRMVIQSCVTLIFQDPMEDLPISEASFRRRVTAEPQAGTSHLK